MKIHLQLLCLQTGGQTENWDIGEVHNLVDGVDDGDNNNDNNMALNILWRYKFYLFENAVFLVAV